jgi:hypothetical protein
MVSNEEWGRPEATEAQVRAGQPFHTPMVLRYDIVQVFHLSAVIGITARRHFSSPRWLLDRPHSQCYDFSCGGEGCGHRGSGRDSYVYGFFAGVTFEKCIAICDVPFSLTIVRP